MVDLVAETEKSVTVEAVNSVLKEAAEGPLLGVLGYTDDPLVSSDFLGDSRSSIVDGQMTRVIGDNMVKILTWYDNEWGYSCRVLDLIKMMSEKGL